MGLTKSAAVTVKVLEPGNGGDGWSAMESVCPSYGCEVALEVSDSRFKFSVHGFSLSRRRISRRIFRSSSGANPGGTLCFLIFIGGCSHSASFRKHQIRQRHFLKRLTTSRPPVFGLPF